MGTTRLGVLVGMAGSAAVIVAMGACGGDDDGASAPKPAPDATVIFDATTGGEDASRDGDATGGDGATPVDAASEAGPVDAGPDASALAAALYDPNNIPKFEITIDAAAVAIFSSTAAADQKTWVHGTFKHGSTVIADVGIRRKGSSTFRAMPQKVALKIRFDKYVAKQRYAGLTELTLNNMTSDPTFLAERLAYHVFRAANLPAQRANTAELTINGESYGIYANVETPNKDLLDRLYGATASSLYEVEYGSEWLPSYEDGATLDVGDPAKADLVALYAAVQAAKPATLLTDVQARLDTAKFLRYCAAEAAVGHYDGYAYSKFGSHNYFLAGDTTGKFTLIPWSTDLSMSDREGVVDAAQPQLADPGVGGDTFLVRCKASATCWPAYKTEVQSVLTLVESLNLPALAQAWHTQIDVLARADPKREADLAYYDAETAKLYAWLAARPALVRTQLGLP